MQNLEMHAAADQDQAARFMQLLEPNLRPLSRFVARALKYSPDADDIVQQTILKAFTHLDSFRFDAQFKTWLRIIAMNEIRQFYRQQRAAKTVAIDPEFEIADRRELPQAAWERRETVSQVRGAIQLLPPKYSTVAELRYLKGLSVSEMAERLSLTVGAVKTRLHRARQQLSAVLAGMDVRATGSMSVAGGQLC